MARRQISQRDARKLKKRVAELEEILRQQSAGWAGEWPQGVHIKTITMSGGTEHYELVKLARRLGHAVVAVPSSTYNDIMLFASKLPSI